MNIVSTHAHTRREEHTVRVDTNAERQVTTYSTCEALRMPLVSNRIDDAPRHRLLASEAFVRKEIHKVIATIRHVALHHKRSLEEHIAFTTSETLRMPDIVQCVDAGTLDGFLARLAV